MAAAFKVFADLHANTKAAEVEISRSFDRITDDNRRMQSKIDAFDKKKAADREKRSKGRRRAVRTGAFGIAGGVAAAAAAGAKDTLEFQKILAGVQIQAGASAAEMGVFERALVKTSRKTSLGRVELASAAETLTNLLGPAAIDNADLLDLLARTAVATGSDITELGGLVSSVSDTMGIAVTDTEAMERALSAFVSAGKQGKIPLSEMAGVLQDVSSTFKEVAPGGVQSAADLAAALQVARKSFGSAAKAGTGLEAAIGAMVKKSADLKKVGVDVFIGKGPEKRLRGFRDILDQIADKRLNIQQLTDILGRKEAVKFLQTFQNPAAREEFERLAMTAANATDISVDFGKKTETQSFRIASAMNKAKLAIGEAMSPERIEFFVTLLAGAAEGVGLLADGFQVTGTWIGEGVAKLGNMLFATDELRAHTALLNAQIDDLRFTYARLQDERAAQIKETIALEAEAAVLSAFAADRDITVEDIKARLEDRGVIPAPIPEQVLQGPVGGALAPVAEAIAEVRAQRVEQGLKEATAAMIRLVEEGTLQQEVNLSPQAIDALNQASFQRAAKELPALPSGVRK